MRSHTKFHSCKPGWISGPSGCYRLFIGNARRLNAKEMCYTHDSHLVIIDSLEENKFLSVLLQTNNDNHVWLTDGLMFRKRWTWRSHVKVISTFYWFPGWMPNKEFAEPSKRGRCISLSNMFEYNGKLYMTTYFFWKVTNCNSVTGFICERKKTPHITEVTDTVLIPGLTIVVLTIVAANVIVLNLYKANVICAAIVSANVVVVFLLLLSLFSLLNATWDYS
ncbi:secretory phospholipase A2 receptor [Octopus bimaculoides]|uniref:secretory phospholipase A2 receptor n=1 Tax=Octopus bimaculoides TaxID=37653 RepID=UPI0022E82281|nr:secretory phospholipase A2 receptor [Octopus bimaculoides]